MASNTHRRPHNTIVSGHWSSKLGSLSHTQKLLYKQLSPKMAFRQPSNSEYAIFFLLQIRLCSSQLLQTRRRLSWQRRRRRLRRCR